MQDIASGQHAEPACALLDQLGTAAPASDAALALFDAAIAVADLDEALLSGAPARALMVAMTAVVTALQRIDPARIARKQGWFHRFTGADLEARLEFEVSIKTIGDEMRKLTMAAQDANRALHLLSLEVEKLEASHPRNEALIMATRELLSRGKPTADTTRLERRLGNLEALHASNQLGRAQMILSIDHLRDLLDRYRDIEQLLFPVGQQHALAVAQSAIGPADLSEQVSALELAQSSLAGALRRNKELVR
jgi:hypothetical protein